MLYRIIWCSLDQDENGLKMNVFIRKTIGEGQKDYIRLGFQSLLKSQFVQRTFERETLKITIYRSFVKPREVRRFDRIWTVR